MSTNALGILIIIVIIIVGVASGGEIFRGKSGLNGSAGSENVADYWGNDGSGTGGSYVPNSRTSQTSANPNASIYEGKVRIDGIRNRGTFNEYFDLSTNLDENEFVGITGWRLRSTVTGRQITIGGAANIPTVGLKDQSPIILPDRAEVVVATGHSPIGTSFRINKCAGYLEEKRNFDPEIWTNCPAVIDDAPPLSREFNDDCLDYIENIYGCNIPKERDFPDNLTRACENFIKTEISYEDCVSRHASDSDFFELEWRVYTGFKGIMSREKREKIELLDNFGRVVDTIEY